MHNVWFLTAAILLGGHIAFIGYMFWIVAELSESGWWFVFSTLLPFALLLAAATGGFAFPAIGIPLAIVAFFIRKRWWQVFAVLGVSAAGMLLPRDSLLLWVSALVFVAVHVFFGLLRGRDSVRALTTGLVLMCVGSVLLAYGMMWS